MNLTELSLQDRREIIRRVQAEYHLNLQVLEKDWWVMAVLRALFALPYARYLSFKGGTSLSKCWNLIERMSEDVDISVDREFLGFGGTLSRTQISNKLRRASCAFVRETLQYDLKRQLIANGVKAEAFSVAVNLTPITTTDPEIIEVSYTSAFQNDIYIHPKVIIEVGGRSMNEPVEQVALQSFIDHVFSEAPFCESPFAVWAVMPERTFLEKLFLLHEEFAKPIASMRTDRMSRHLYDISQIMDTPIAERALSNKTLYAAVVEHRRIFIGLKGFDYTTLYPQTLRITPPGEVLDMWRKDYEAMQDTMIYGGSLPFDRLMERIREFNIKINRM